MRTSYPLTLIGILLAMVFVVGAGSVRAAIVAPTDIPGTVLWLDAADTGSITSAGGLVSQWSDKSAVGTNHFVDNGWKPQTGVASLNGNNVLTFDGIDDRLVGPAVLGAGDDDYTYIAVWQPHKNSGLQRVYEQYELNVSNRYGAMLAFVNGRYGFNGQNNDRHDLIPFGANQWRVTQMEVQNNLPIPTEGGNIRVYDNGGGYVGRTGNPATLNLGTTAATIGAKNAGANAEFLDGDLAEVIVYDRTLSYAEKYDLSVYLDTKYNLGVALPEMGLAHRWSFNDGTADDSVGGAHGALSGGATLDGQRLRIDGAGKMLTSPIGTPIAEKTMIVWTSLEDPTVSTKGSALTLENNAAGDTFDAIVYGEADPMNWMAGSNFFQRTQNPQLYGTDETVSNPDEVMIAIVYGADDSITLYREAVLYGSYYKGDVVNYDANALVQIGPRHGNHADVYDGWVNEARIYNYALSLDDIQQLYRWGPDVIGEPAFIPEPSTLVLLAVGGVFALISLRRRRPRRGIAPGA